MHDTEQESLIRESNHQQEMVINGRYFKPTQLEKLRNLFERRQGTWIPLPDILKLGIAQYATRVHELRFSKDKHHKPMNIINRTETVDGVKHSFYKYIQSEKNGQLRMGI